MEQQENQNQRRVRDSVFILSSAIHSKHGIYSSEERLKQTIESCKSILSRVDRKENNIVILDGGYKELSLEEKKELEPYIKVFFSFAESMAMYNITYKID